MCTSKWWGFNTYVKDSLEKTRSNFYSTITNNIFSLKDRRTEKHLIVSFLFILKYEIRERLCRTPISFLVFIGSHIIFYPSPSCLKWACYLTSRTLSNVNNCSHFDLFMNSECIYSCQFFDSEIWWVKVFWATLFQWNVD